ncbi:MAG: selenide, water dikinase SelD [Clostridiales bacterium 38-18]|nr:MAG: selenide, water dikinase SelD [Clostridiales bacterium 38-18]
MNHEQLLVGFESSDDAAVYKINDDQAVIQTLDFFTPIVDDPYDFGAIAAANALSDVYAMGGTPTLAMNIVGFPNCLSPDILKQIMHGGADKVIESGALLIGGHSIEDEEPKYGLSVMGMVSPDAVWKNIGAQPGDTLVLTKPLGIGVLTTALKEGLIDDETIRQITIQMATLNKLPSAQAKALKLDVHACTDITGFGLVGHALEMAVGSEVSITLVSESIKYITKAYELAEMGIIPAGAYKNRAHANNKVSISESASEVVVDLMFDPQTSGGLLFALTSEDAERLLRSLSEVYPLEAYIVGQVMHKMDKAIYIK